MYDHENNVVLTKEDVKNVLDFFTHFNIPCPAYLSEIIKEIANSEKITFQQQQKIKVAISRAIIDNQDHKILKDELFEEAMPNCQQEWFKAQFEQDLQESLADDTEDDNQ
jgi:hypothetical protein